MRNYANLYGVGYLADTPYEILPVIKHNKKRKGTSRYRIQYNTPSDITKLTNSTLFLREYIDPDNDKKKVKFRLNSENYINSENYYRVPSRDILLPDPNAENIDKPNHYREYIFAGLIVVFRRYDSGYIFTKISKNSIKIKAKIETIHDDGSIIHSIDSIECVDSWRVI